MQKIALPEMRKLLASVELVCPEITVPLLFHEYVSTTVSPSMSNVVPAMHDSVLDVVGLVGVRERDVKTGGEFEMGTAALIIAVPCAVPSFGVTRH